MKIDDIKMLIKFEKQLNLKETSNKNLKSDGFVKDENAICLKLIGRIRQLYALNFQEEFNFERYLLNCIFVSLKLIGISSLSGQQKLSLLAWAIASQEYIQILNERQAAQQPAIVC